MTRNSLKAIALSGGAIVALAYASAASAQAAAAQGTDVEAVVVTGSRVITNGYAAPTPVTVITAEQMRATAPNSISDAINQLPQFKASYTAAATGFGATANAGNGGSFANLRGLSAKRGLVLLNGQRVVQSQANGGIAGAVDLNVLPQGLVQRADVVTGGASAAYGSDALTGVVNFVLDTKFQGVKGEIRGGLSKYGDSKNVGATLTLGHAFLDDRLHVVSSFEYFRNSGITNYSARPYANGVATINNCAVPQTSLSCPSRIITGPVVASNLSSGGLIVAGATALAGAATQPSTTAPRYSFAGNGQIVPFPYGTLVNTGSMVGGGIDGELGRYFNFMPSNMRRNGYVRVGYDLSPKWSINADLLYGDSTNKFHGFYMYGGQTGNFTIFQDNVYLPPSVAALMGGPGATSALLYNPASGLFNGARVNTISINRINLDFPQATSTSYTSTLRFQGGIDGEVAGWKVGAYYTHGFAMNKNTTSNLALVSNLFSAVDAVASPGTAGLPAAGTPICRSTITNPGNGCVPVNLLGNNTISAAAINYIRGGGTGTSALTQKLQQDAAEFTFRGEPVSTWAGPVAVGGGVAYRREAVVGYTDAASTMFNPATPGTAAYKAGITPVLTINGFPAAKQGLQNLWQAGFANGGSKGTLDVKEVFGEVLIPLANDMPFAKQLDFNGAIRYADYQYGGGQTNWKIGVVYKPIADIKFRATQSRDIRAPNLADLFASPTVTLPGVNDFFRKGTNGQVEAANFGNTISQGNPNLVPERGDTTTVGVVFTPSFAPGLTLSVDYYHILITNAIAAPGGQVIVNQCFAGNTQFCNYITRNSDPASFGAGNTIGPITALFNPVLNIGTQKNAGLDIEASYNLPLSRLFSGRDDSLTFRALFNYQGKNTSYVVGGTFVTSGVGINSGFIQGTGGNVDWSGTMTATYRNGPLTINVQERFINKGRIQATVDEQGNPYPANAIINPNQTSNGLVPNTVPAYWYTSLSVNYTFGPNRRYETFINVSNLFNKQPPQALGTFLGYGVIPTNYSLYDVIGRNFTMGVRFKY
ncbi:MAG: TonB-dependent receptor [Caulobacteraceae bacterium]